MALREPTLAGGVTVNAGALYCINGKPTVAPLTQTVSAWAASIGGSPTISTCAAAARISAGPFGPSADLFGT